MSTTAMSVSTTATTTTTSSLSNDVYVRGTRELRNRLYFFDRVKILLRDRIRNASDTTSTDSTVNYSSISNESENPDFRHLFEPPSEIEEGNETTPLGPRGLDPMLSSTSQSADAVDDGLLFPTTGTSETTQVASNGETPTANNEDSRARPDFSDPWDSESETVPFPSSLDPSPVGGETNQRVPSNDTQRINEETRPNSRNESSGTATAVQDESSSEFSVRQGIQILSLHIENMQRLCRYLYFLF